MHMLNSVSRKNYGNKGKISHLDSHFQIALFSAILRPEAWQIGTPVMSRVASPFMMR